uniref:Uncharacterized protein n=1 Tax=Romanomermis culicivorax TaxID=13658 RepID=A0A915JB80_ROMCU
MVCEDRVLNLTLNFSASLEPDSGLAPRIRPQIWMNFYRKFSSQTQQIGYQSIDLVELYPELCLFMGSETPNSEDESIASLMGCRNVINFSIIDHCGTIQCNNSSIV